MLKVLGFLMVLVIAFLAMGYRVHPENISHYLKTDQDGQRVEVVLNKGASLQGILKEETEDSITINSDGAVLTFSKAEIRSTKTTAHRNFFETLAHNFETYQSSYPLITKNEKDSAKGMFDNFALEPSRIAEDMQKKNPGLSATKTVQDQMAANARARLAAFKARQAAEGQS